ncbi:MAG: kstR2 7 [Marmoricola sp.]|nr:kstR2 7 [Marmoricola sp.]
MPGAAAGSASELGLAIWTEQTLSSFPFAEHDGRVRPTLRFMANDRAERTRARLVEAGVETLLTMTATDLVTAKGTRDIAQRAGVSVGTFFHHFESVDVYAGAVVERVFNPVLPLASDEEIGPQVTEVANSKLPSEASKDLHSSEFRRLSGDHEHRLRVGLWALGGPEGRNGYGQYMRERDEPLYGLAAEIYDGWGRELRPPVDMPLFVAIQAAMLSGAVLRASADPGSITEQSYGLTASALGIYLLRMKGETRSLGDKITEINYFPSDRTRSRTSLTARQQTSRVALLAAGAALFGEFGYEGTTVAQVARAAGVSTSTLYELVGGKPELAVLLLFQHAQDALVDGADAPTDPAALLDARLAKIYRTAAAHSLYAAPYAAHLVNPTPLPGRDPILEATAGALTDAKNAGLISEELDVDALAPILLASLLRRVVSNPAEGAHGTTVFLRRYLLDGWA